MYKRYKFYRKLKIFNILSIQTRENKLSAHQIIGTYFNINILKISSIYIFIFKIHKVLISIKKKLGHFIFFTNNYYNYRFKYYSKIFSNHFCHFIPSKTWNELTVYFSSIVKMVKLVKRNKFKTLNLFIDSFFFIFSDYKFNKTPKLLKALNEQSIPGLFFMNSTQTSLNLYTLPANNESYGNFWIFFFLNLIFK